MRLDKYMKVSRLVKRRTVANEACDAGRVQINGKVRDKLVVPKDISREELEKAALASDKIAEFTEGKEIFKVITVPGKLVNLVVK